MKNLECLKSNLFEQITSKNLLAGSGFETGWGHGSQKPIFETGSTKKYHHVDDNWMSKYIRAARNPQL